MRPFSSAADFSASSSGMERSPMRHREENLRATSPLRRDHTSPSRMGASGYGNSLSVPGGHASYTGASPSRSSPLKPSTELTRSLLQKSASKEPPRSPARASTHHDYSSPSRSGYGGKKRDSPMRGDEEE